MKDIEKPHRKMTKVNWILLFVIVGLVALTFFPSNKQDTKIWEDSVAYWHRLYLSAETQLAIVRRQRVIAEEKTLVVEAERDKIRLDKISQQKKYENIIIHRYSSPELDSIISARYGYKR